MTTRDRPTYDEYCDYPAQTDKGLAVWVYVKIERDPERADPVLSTESRSLHPGLLADRRTVSRFPTLVPASAEADNKAVNTPPAAETQQVSCRPRTPPLRGRGTGQPGLARQPAF
jgi:hypothetical protein